MKIPSPVYMAAAKDAPKAETAAKGEAATVAAEGKVAAEPEDSVVDRVLTATLDDSSMLGKMTENIYRNGRLPAVASAAALIGAYAGWKGVAAVGVIGALGAGLYAASNSDGRDVNVAKVMLSAGAVGVAASGLGAFLSPEKALIMSAAAVVGSAGYGVITGAQDFADSQRAQAD